MLEDKDRIFQNLYNDKGADLKSAMERGDWVSTKEICLNELKMDPTKFESLLSSGALEEIKPEA